jgi:hypothetical protein
VKHDLLGSKQVSKPRFFLTSGEGWRRLGSEEVRVWFIGVGNRGGFELSLGVGNNPVIRGIRA